MPNYTRRTNVRPDVSRWNAARLEVFLKSVLIVDYTVRPSIVSNKVIKHPKRVDIACIRPIQLVGVLVHEPQMIEIPGTEFYRLACENGGILADAGILQELVRKPDLIPSSWERTVWFLGTMFEQENVQRFFLGLKPERSRHSELLHCNTSKTIGWQVVRHWGDYRTHYFSRVDLVASVRH